MFEIKWEPGDRVSPPVACGGTLVARIWLSGEGNIHPYLALGITPAQVEPGWEWYAYLVSPRGDGARHTDLGRGHGRCIRSALEMAHCKAEDLVRLMRAAVAYAKLTGGEDV